MRKLTRQEADRVMEALYYRCAGIRRAWENHPMPSGVEEDLAAFQALAMEFTESEITVGDRYESGTD